MLAACPKRFSWAKREANGRLPAKRSRTGKFSTRRETKSILQQDTERTKEEDPSKNHNEERREWGQKRELQKKNERDSKVLSSGGKGKKNEEEKSTGPSW